MKERINFLRKIFNGKEGELRVIFNHLLIRVLYFGSERLILMSQLLGALAKYANQPESRVKTEREIELIAQSVVSLRESIRVVLEAVDEAKPTIFTEEQEKIIQTIKRVFRWSADDYRKAMDKAAEIKLRTHLVEQLRSEELESPAT